MSAEGQYQSEIIELALNAAEHPESAEYLKAAAAFARLDGLTTAAVVLVRFLGEKLDEAHGLEPGQYLRALDLSIRVNLGDE